MNTQTDPNRLAEIEPHKVFSSTSGKDRVTSPATLRCSRCQAGVSFDTQTLADQWSKYEQLRQFESALLPQSAKLFEGRIHDLITQIPNAFATDFHCPRCGLPTVVVWTKEFSAHQNPMTFFVANRVLVQNEFADFLKAIRSRRSSIATQPFGRISEGFSELLRCLEDFLQECVGEQNGKQYHRALKKSYETVKQMTLVSSLLEELNQEIRMVFEREVPGDRGALETEPTGFPKTAVTRDLLATLQALQNKVQKEL